MSGKLPARTFVGVLLLVGSVLFAVLGTALMGARKAAAASAERGLEQAADLVAQLLAGRSRSLAGGARVFVQGPYFRTLVAERRRDDILDQTFEAAEQLDASWVFITDATGMLVAKSDEPSASGDQLSGVPLIAGALRGQVTSGFGGSGDSLLFLATAVPITAPGGTAFGVLVATTTLDSTTAADIAVATGAHVVFYLRDEAGRAHVTAATLPLDSVARGALLHALDSDTVARARPATGARLTPQSLSFGDSSWFTYPSALNTAGGSEVGGYLVLRPATGPLVGANWFQQSLLVGIALAVMFAGLASLLVDRSVAAPLRHLQWSVERRREGNGANAARLNGAAGEIASLSSAIDAWQQSLDERTALAKAVESAPIDATGEPRPSEPSRARARRGENTIALTIPATRSGDPGPLHLEAGDWLAHRYHIEARVGGGPAGVVYRAHDRARQESVALKLLRPELLPEDSATRAESIERVRLLGALHQEHLVRVHDVGEANETLFVSAEFVSGPSLRAVLQTRTAIDRRVIVSIARQMLYGLSAIHTRGLVHGDIKPGNVLLASNGVIKLSDAGISQLMRATNEDARRRADDATARDRQIGGRVLGASVGAPDYMAPEQLIGAPPTAMSDLYAVGVILHEARSGSTPFTRQSPLEGLAAKLRETPGVGVAAIHHAEMDAVPTSLDAWIAWLLAPEPRERPSSARHALDQLEQALLSD